MMSSFAYRPWAIALIRALVFALVGLGFAPAAMAMPTSGPSMDSMEMTSSPFSKVCLDCEGADHSKTATVHCPAAVCSGVIAILPANVGLGVARKSTFVLVTQNEGRGIIISPDLGPPRAPHLI